MERERRYTIFKHKDIEKYLSESEIATLFKLESKIAFARQQEDRGLLTAVVVESDWPEYEPTWKAIEARVDLEAAYPGWEKRKPFLGHECYYNAKYKALIIAEPNCSALSMGNLYREFVGGENHFKSAVEHAIETFKENSPDGDLDDCPDIENQPNPPIDRALCDSLVNRGR